MLPNAVGELLKVVGVLQKAILQHFRDLTNLGKIYISRQVKQARVEIPPVRLVLPLVISVVWVVPSTKHHAKPLHILLPDPPLNWPCLRGIMVETMAIRGYWYLFSRFYNTETWESGGY